MLKTELDHADADAPIHATDKCFFQETVAPESSGRITLCTLQFLPCPFHITNYTWHGGWSHNGNLGDGATTALEFSYNHQNLNVKEVTIVAKPDDNTVLTILTILDLLGKQETPEQVQRIYKKWENVLKERPLKK